MVNGLKHEKPLVETLNISTIYSSLNENIWSPACGNNTNNNNFIPTYKLQEFKNKLLSLVY